jgi:hypothetical protein
MRKNTLLIFGISISIALLTAGVGISAQDKYALKVPNGLAFSPRVRRLVSHCRLKKR